MADATGIASEWPQADGRRVVFLLDASSRLERRLLEGWIRERCEAAGNGTTAVAIPPSRLRRRRPLDPRHRLLSVSESQLHLRACCQFVEKAAE